MRAMLNADGSVALGEWVDVVSTVPVGFVESGAADGSARLCGDDCPRDHAQGRCAVVIPPPPEE